MRMRAMPYLSPSYSTTLYLYHPSSFFPIKIILTICIGGLLGAAAAGGDWLAGWLIDNMFIVCRAYVQHTNRYV